MSQKAVHEIIGRAVTDEGFRTLLFSNADAALAEYDLSAAERSMLTHLDHAELEAFVGRLDPRITKAKWIDV